MVPMIMQKYGVEIGENGEDFDQIKSFRRFLLFVRDTIKWNKPMEPDIHWFDTSGHVSTFIHNGGRYDHVFWTEKFNEGMQHVLDRVDVKHPITLNDIPRFNESTDRGPKRQYRVEDYFDDLSMHLIYEIYHQDFQVFKYDFENPANPMPIGEIDLDELHARLGP
jgi:hypothetical protein